MDTQIATILGQLPPNAQQNLLEYAEFLLEKYVAQTNKDQGLELTSDTKKLLDERLTHHEENQDKGISIATFKQTLIEKYGYSL